MTTLATAERATLKSIYVARTLEQPQGKFETFLGGMRRYLGRTATVKNISDTHLTFLESRGVKEKFYSYGYGTREVEGFQLGLQSFLNKRGHNTPLKARVNQAAPLRWAGRLHKVALNLMPDDRLLEQRDDIETYLLSQFGVVPELVDFEPHITIGSVDITRLSSSIAKDVCQDANELMPGGLVVPSRVTLNGLSTYVSRIHPPYRRQLAEAG